MTDRDKQIEEIFKDLCEAPIGAVKEDFTIGTMKDSHTDLCIRTIAGHLYANGYRKATDIFEEIEKLISSECLVIKDEAGIRGYVDASVHYILAKLKKKYEILNSWEELTHTCQIEIPHTIESIADLAFTESEGEG